MPLARVEEFLMIVKKGITNKENYIIENILERNNNKEKNFIH